MIPIPAPPEAIAGRPDCTIVRMGPPRGVADEDCGTAEMLISQVEEIMPGYTARRQYAYYRPTDAEIAMLHHGGFIEIGQHGMTVQPFCAAIWQAEA